MYRNTIIAIASCAGFASTSLAGGTNVLSDANSIATFNTTSGQVSWLVDGIEQLFTQEFYFRRATDTREYRVDSTNLSLDGIFTSDTNPFTDVMVQGPDSISLLVGDGTSQFTLTSTVSPVAAGACAAHRQSGWRAG